MKTTENEDNESYFQTNMLLKSALCVHFSAVTIKSSVKLTTV